MSRAQTVQVPEACIGRVTPCMIRTEDRAFRFILGGRQIGMLKDTLLNITFVANKNNIEIREGRISLGPEYKNSKTLTVNNKFVDSNRLLMSRFVNKLTSLNLKSYILNTYNLQTRAKKSDVNLPSRLSSEFSSELSSELSSEFSSEFITKKDFITYTKYYFKSRSQHNRFIANEAPKWKQEFTKQNDTQTKVLRRSIASETEKSKKEVERSVLELAEQKKVRVQFFNRTFTR